MRFFMLALAAFGLLLAGCLGGDGDAPPPGTATPAPTPTSSPTPTPTATPDPSPAVEVSAGRNHTCALLKSGRGGLLGRHVARNQGPVVSSMSRVQRPRPRTDICLDST